MSVSIRDQILAASALKTDVVKVSDSLSVRIREFSIEQRERLFAKREGSGALTLAALVVVEGCIEEDGKRAFSDDDVEALRTVSPTIIDELSSAILTLSGIKKAKEDDDEGETKA